MRRETLLRLHPDDNVAVLLRDVAAGDALSLGESAYRAPAALTMGHKLAIRAIEPGRKILKYGAPIGSATRAIRPGEHVHLHNMKSDYQMHHISREEARDGQS